jgi:hypothetical protein
LEGGTIGSIPPTDEDQDGSEEKELQRRDETRRLETRLTDGQASSRELDPAQQRHVAIFMYALTTPKPPLWSVVIPNTLITFS